MAIIHRTGAEGAPTPCCGISYSEMTRRGERHTSVEKDITCSTPPHIAKTPEQHRIEMLERRCEQLENALLYLSNTLGMYGVIAPEERNPSLKMYQSAQFDRRTADEFPWGFSATG